MIEQFVVQGQAGTGSVAVEAALTLLGLSYRVEEVMFEQLQSGVNPMAQVPSLRLPGGSLMTESAAILIWLADSNPGGRLAPAFNHPARPAFLRWMLFVSSAIYALYWVMDLPARFAADAPHEAVIVERAQARIAACWAVMESGLTPGRYLLGEGMTVLDLYATVVSRWTPREALHQTIAPRIGAVVRRVEADPRLATLWATRFPLREAVS